MVLLEKTYKYLNESLTHINFSKSNAETKSNINLLKTETLP